jgi:protease I
MLFSRWEIKADMQGQRNQLNGMRVAIVVDTDFEEAEMVEPRKALETAGARVTLISTKPGQTQAMDHDQKSKTYKVDMTLDQARPDDFDALHLPGGALNADVLRTIPKALEFVRDFDEKNKPVAAICHAPWVLVSANLVCGRNLTSYYTVQDDIRNAGGHWLDEPAVRDRNWVTSRQPDDIPNNFNPAMIELFAEFQSKNQQQKTKGVVYAS